MTAISAIIALDAVFAFLLNALGIRGVPMATQYTFLPAAWLSAAWTARRRGA